MDEVNMQTDHCGKKEKVMEKRLQDILLARVVIHTRKSDLPPLNSVKYL
jgi:hypothetical protein